MNRRNARRLALVAFVACVSWWLIFGVLLPSRVEESVREFFSGIELEVDEVDLSWGSGTLKEIRLTGKGFEAFSLEAVFTYSPIDWCFGDTSSMQDLQIKGMRLKSSKEELFGETFWNYLEDLRVNENLSSLDSLGLEGEYLWDGKAFPFKISSIRPDFEKSARIEFVVDVAPSLIPLDSETEPQGKTKGVLQWERHRSSSASELALTVTFPSEVQTMVSSSKLGQVLLFKYGDKRSPRFSLRAERKKGSPSFSGDWNSTLVTADLVPFWPVLSLVNLRSTGGGDFTWNPKQNTFDASLAMVAELSSFFFRDAGKVKAELTARLFRDLNGTTVLSEIVSEVSDQLGERFELQSLRPWKVGREKALARIIIDGFRLGRFSEDLPSRLAFSGETEVEFDETGVLTRFKEVALRDTGEDWARLSGLVDVNLPLDGETPASFSVDAELGSAFLGRIFPEGDFGEVFGSGQSVGRLKLSGAWNRGDLEVSTAEGSFSASSGECSLAFSSLNKFKLLLREKSLGLAPLFENDRESDAFHLSAANLPIDGLLDWPGGRLQGNLFEANGTVFFRGDQVGFRAKNLSVENLQILQDKKVLFEGLNLSGSPLYVVSADQSGLLNLTNFRLSGDNAEMLQGDLSLSLKSGGEEGETNISKIESTRLELDPKGFSYLDLPHFTNLGEGSLSVKKLKVSLGDGFTLELDASFVGKEGAPSIQSNEKNLKAGLSLTVEENSQGLSAWLGVRLSGEPSDSIAEFDFHSKSSKAKLVAENLGLAQVVPFLETFSLSEANGSSRGLIEGLVDLSKNWQIDLRSVQLSNGLVLKKLIGEANASSDKSMHLHLSGMFGDGNFSSSSEMSFQKALAVPSFEKLLVAVEDCNISLLKPLGSLDSLPNGILSSEANGSFSVDSGFVGDLRLNLKQVAFPAISDANLTRKRTFLLERLTRTLGEEVRLPERQLVGLENLVELLPDIGLCEISLEINRSSDGKLTISKFQIENDSIEAKGFGEVLPSGRMKLSLRVGVRGELGKALEALGMLSAGGKLGEYRILKNAPLVIEGSLYEPDFANLWRLLAKGMGLAPE